MIGDCYSFPSITSEKLSGQARDSYETTRSRETIDECRNRDPKAKHFLRRTPVRVDVAAIRIAATDVVPRAVAENYKLAVAFPGPAGTRDYRVFAVSFVVSPAGDRLWSLLFRDVIMTSHVYARNFQGMEYGRMGHLHQLDRWASHLNVKSAEEAFTFFDVSYPVVYLPTPYTQSHRAYDLIRVDHIEFFVSVTRPVHLEEVTHGIVVRKVIEFET